MAPEPLDVSWSSGKGDAVMSDRQSLEAARWPMRPWQSAIHDLTNGQNVAGMWLKYGVKP